MAKSKQAKAKSKDAETSDLNDDKDPLVAIEEEAPAGDEDKSKGWDIEGTDDPYPRFETEKDLSTVEYWCGTRDDCPFQNVTLGGFSFPKFVETVSDDVGMITQRDKHKGQIYHLTQKQVEKIKDAAIRKVIAIGSVPRWHNRGNPKYRPAANHVPSGRFVYMVPVNDLGSMARSNKVDPPALVQ